MRGERMALFKGEWVSRVDTQWCLRSSKGGVMRRLTSDVVLAEFGKEDETDDADGADDEADGEDAG